MEQKQSAGELRRFLLLAVAWGTLCRHTPVALMDEFANLAERINLHLRHCANITQVKDDLREVVHRLVARCNAQHALGFPMSDLCSYEFLQSKNMWPDDMVGLTSHKLIPDSFIGQGFLLDVYPFVVHVGGSGSGTVCTVDDDWYLLSCAAVVSASNGTIVFFHEDGVGEKDQVVMTMDVSSICTVSADGQAVLVR